MHISAITHRDSEGSLRQIRLTQAHIRQGPKAGAGTIMLPTIQLITLIPVGGDPSCGPGETWTGEGCSGAGEGGGGCPSEFVAENNCNPVPSPPPCATLDEEGFLPTGCPGEPVPPSAPASPSPKPCGSSRDAAFVSNNMTAAIQVSDATATWRNFGMQNTLSAVFVLAWAANESQFGTSPVSRINNNYFGEIASQTCFKGVCVGNPNKAAPWQGAVACAAMMFIVSNPNWACFTTPNLLGSALAAISSHNGAYVRAAAGATGVAGIAQAIADAGWCTNDPRCPNGGYGRAVQADYNELVPVVDCLYPWLIFAPGIFQ